MPAEARRSARVSEGGDTGGHGRAGKAILTASGVGGMSEYEGREGRKFKGEGGRAKVVQRGSTDSCVAILSVLIDSLLLKMLCSKARESESVGKRAPGGVM